MLILKPKTQDMIERELRQIAESLEISSSNAYMVKFLKHDSPLQVRD